MVSVPPGIVRINNVQLQNESPFMFTILNLTNMITNLILGGMAVSAFMYANVHKSRVITQHVYLCVFGYAILMVQAIQSVNIHTGWARAFSCDNKRAVHGLLQVIGSVIAIAGAARVIFENGMRHVTLRFRHFHSVFGLIAMLLTILSLIGGVMNLYSSRLTLNKRFLRVVHAVGGYLTIIFAFMAMIAYPNKGETHKKHVGLGDTNEKLFLALTIISFISILASSIMNVRRLLVS